MQHLFCFLPEFASLQDANDTSPTLGCDMLPVKVFLDVARIHVDLHTNMFVVTS